MTRAIPGIDPVAGKIGRAAFQPRHVQEVGDEHGARAGLLLDARQQICVADNWHILSVTFATKPANVRFLWLSTAFRGRERT